IDARRAALNNPIVDVNWKRKVTALGSRLICKVWVCRVKLLAEISVGCGPICTRVSHADFWFALIWTTRCKSDDDEQYSHLWLQWAPPDLKLYSTDLGVVARQSHGINLATRNRDDPGVEMQSPVRAYCKREKSDHPPLRMAHRKSRVVHECVRGQRQRLRV